MASKQADSEAKSLLRKHFGYEDFKPNQEGVIENVIAGRDVLAVMPTGGGKSVCYQIPAMHLWNGGKGYTLVVSPLISLMADQAAALEAAGIPAAVLNSTKAYRGQRAALNAVAAGEAALLYVSPERLAAKQFERFSKEHPPALIAVDEAHCVSQWGHDFREAYRDIKGFAESLPTRPPIAAFTATATEAVRKDIVDLVGLRKPYTVVASYDRPNLFFEVERCADADDRNRRLMEVLRRHKGESGIVYCGTRRNVDEVAKMLAESFGDRVFGYHAGMDHAVRAANQQAFVGRDDAIAVATNAFGMGIDKSNVSFVVHYNMPLSLENYYQEAGRAGRDGRRAECTVLFHPDDVDLCAFLIRRTRDEAVDADPEDRRRQYEASMQRMRAMEQYCRTGKCLRAYILGYFGEVSQERCDNCANCEAAAKRKPLPTGSRKKMRESALYRALMAERDRIALRDGKTAYKLIPDRAIEDICMTKPRTMHDLDFTAGMTRKGVERYGKDIMKIVGRCR